MSADRLPPVPGVDPDAAQSPPSLQERIVQKMRLAYSASARFRDALDADELSEAAVHYMLDQVGRMKRHLDEISKMLIDAELKRPAAAAAAPRFSGVTFPTNDQSHPGSTPYEGGA